MKKILVLFFIILSVQFINAQNPEYRVDKIKETLYRMDTTVYEKNFSYTDGKLNTITVTEDGKPYDLFTYLYKKENVTVNSKLRGDGLNSFVLNNGVIESYKSNKANTFTVTREESRTSMVTHDDRCNKLNYRFQFVYENTGRISAVNLFPTTSSTSPASVYKFFYNDKNQLERMDMTHSGGSVYRSYAFTYTGKQLMKIEVTFNGKFENGYEFTYDTNGNITEEKVFDSTKEKPTLRKLITITYAKEKGNDSMIWDIYDWEFTMMYGIRTYVPIPTPCY